jgi:DNA-binding NarL/FixJ family response regulator
VLASQRVRILLVDDHPLVVDGLAALARQSPQLEVVGIAHGGREGVELCLRHRPDVTVM